jgi:hypothetical protein
MPVSALQAGGGDLLHEAYQALMQLAFVDAPDSMITLAKHIQTDYRRPDVQHYTAQLVKARPRTPRVDTLPLDSIVAVFRPQIDWGAGSRPSVLPIAADYWFPVGTDTLRPDTGKVTLVVVLTGACTNPGAGGWYGREACASVLTHVQHWREQYGTDQLQMVVVAVNNGRAVFSTQVPPAEEAKQIAWFVHDYVGLEVPVAVQVRSDAKQTEAPYGPRPRELAPIQLATGATKQCHDGTCNYWNSLDFGVVLVGADGRILAREMGWRSTWPAFGGPGFTSLLAKTIARNTTSTATGRTAEDAPHLHQVSQSPPPAPTSKVP